MRETILFLFHKGDRRIEAPDPVNRIARFWRITVGKGNPIPTWMVDCRGWMWYDDVPPNKNYGIFSPSGLERKGKREIEKAVKNGKNL